MVQSAARGNSSIFGVGKPSAFRPFCFCSARMAAWHCWRYGTGVKSLICSVALTGGASATNVLP